MQSKVKEYLFVDAYNIINSWPEFKETNKTSLESSRDKLIEIMSEYQSYTGIKVSVVFDAHLVKGRSENKEIFHDVEVVYTKEYETADSYIEKVVNCIGRKKRVRVATSDWAEQQIIFGRGATRISARELREEIKLTKMAIKKETQKNRKTTITLMDRLDNDVLEKLDKIRRKK